MLQNNYVVQLVCSQGCCWNPLATHWGRNPFIKRLCTLHHKYCTWLLLPFIVALNGTDCSDVAAMCWQQNLAPVWWDKANTDFRRANSKSYVSVDFASSVSKPWWSKLPAGTPAVWWNKSVVEQKEYKEEKIIWTNWRSPSPDRTNMSEGGIYVHKDRGDRFCVCSKLAREGNKLCPFLSRKRKDNLFWIKKKRIQDNCHTGLFLLHLCKYFCIQWQQILKVHLLLVNTSTPTDPTSHALTLCPLIFQIIEREEEEEGEISGFTRILECRFGLLCMVSGPPPCPSKQYTMLNRRFCTAHGEEKGEKKE